MRNPEYESLISKWLENKLTTEESLRFDQLCLEDEIFAQRVANASRFTLAADQFEQLPLPEWNKEATFFETNAQPRWWQRQWMPMASMAMSVVAMVMVLSGFQVQMTDGKMTLGFDRGPDEKEINQLVAKRLDEYKESNQLLLTQYMDAMAKQQQENGAQLTQYLLSSSRQERREDFAELVKFINQQRTDDQRFYARQINDLEQEIEAIGSTYSGLSRPLETSHE
ncbi:hypothetical protein [Alteromonas sp. ASW11-130]|uniref:hypothetical protein n=1 Tax=Alteromonas sp. ASW11-130 TaxID=3015775 RepID=UPI0022425AC4|nr:hypothetical protein [Alteromonas sp. ASW11-130]MCW8090415.1 hypothetical protein [Alteromonas sp. ASW11-130]